MRVWILLENVTDPMTCWQVSALNVTRHQSLLWHRAIYRRIIFFVCSQIKLTALSCGLQATVCSLNSCWQTFYLICLGFHFSNVLSPVIFSHVANFVCEFTSGDYRFSNYAILETYNIRFKIFMISLWILTILFTTLFLHI